MQSHTGRRYAVSDGMLHHDCAIQAGATRHYAAWCDAIGGRRLRLEAFRECTMAQPTWMLHRDAFEVDSSRDIFGIPNDTIP